MDNAGYTRERRKDWVEIRASRAVVWAAGIVATVLSGVMLLALSKAVQSFEDVADQVNANSMMIARLESDVEWLKQAVRQLEDYKTRSDRGP